KQSKGMDSSKQSKGMDSSKQSKGMDSSKQSKGMDSSKQSLKQPKEIDSKSPLIDLNETYGKTISSIQDYFDINQYFKYFRVNSKKSEDFINFSEREYRKFGSNYISTQMNTNLQIESSIFGNSEIGKNYYVKSSNILNGCKIQGNLQNCIIWEDVFVKKNLKECLVISNDENGIIYLDKCDEDDLSDSKSDESDQETFFNNLIDYLQSVYDKMDEKETDMDDVLRQVSLLRISWNASNLDLIEAFGMFLCKTYNPNDLDNIIIKTSCFFPIIHGLTDDPNSQDLLMTSLNDHLKEEDIERKKKFVIRYGFIFLEDGLISRAVIKKYRNLMKKKS
ncbi:Translation initiation factor eif-2b epsilon subunit, partial [Pseudoloma neurophilia]